MPLYSSPGFQPYVAANHVEAATAFARELVKASGTDLQPGAFSLVNQSENDLGGTVHHFKYELHDSLGAIASRREIRVIHYNAVSS